MALVGALSSLRASVLRHISVPSQGAAAQQSLGAACSLIFRRGFAEGTYLDKGQVTDRVLEVTKNFGSKVDSSKVSAASPRWPSMTVSRARPLAHTGSSRDHRMLQCRAPVPPNQAAARDCIHARTASIQP